MLTKVLPGEPPFEATRSCLPSPLRSPTATHEGYHVS